MVKVGMILRYEYKEELMKGKILFTTYLCACLVIVFTLLEGQIFKILSMLMAFLGLAVVSFLIYTEDKLGKIQFSISPRALIVFYRETDFWIYYEDMDYIKVTNYGLSIGLKGLDEEFAILNKMDNFHEFLKAIKAKAKEYGVEMT